MAASQEWRTAPNERAAERTNYEEINKLQALRQILIEKNLARTFSDEIFREQNALLERKIIAAQMAKNDSLIDKYDINAITEFIKIKISNLALTYSTSTLNQLRCLLALIFLSGFTWDYPGCSNRNIRPIYQSILDYERWSVQGGCPTYQQFKPVINRSKPIKCKEFLTFSFYHTTLR